MMRVRGPADWQGSSNWSDKIRPHTTWWQSGGWATDVAEGSPLRGEGCRGPPRFSGGDSGSCPPLRGGTIRWRGRRRGRGMQETSYSIRDLLGWADHLTVGKIPTGRGWGGSSNRARFSCRVRWCSLRSLDVPPFGRLRLRVAEQPRAAGDGCPELACQFFLTRT
jgi:hypothetical protein